MIFQKKWLPEKKIIRNAKSGSMSPRNNTENISLSKTILKKPRKLPSKGSQNDILFALQASKEGMSARRATVMYNILRETLHNKIKGRTPIQCSMSHPAYLTAEEDKVIIQ